MRILRIPFKILTAPVVLALTITVAMLRFLFAYAAGFLEVVSGIGVLISVLLLLGKYTVGGCVYLFLSFLISPLGLPILVERLIDGIDDFNFWLWRL